jgi:hypothetical protein
MALINVEQERFEHEVDAVYDELLKYIPQQRPLWTKRNGMLHTRAPTLNTHHAVSVDSFVVALGFQLNLFLFCHRVRHTLARPNTRSHH